MRAYFENLSKVWNRVCKLTSQNVVIYIYFQSTDASKWFEEFPVKMSSSFQTIIKYFHDLQYFEWYSLRTSFIV